MMAGLALVALGSCSNTDYTEKYQDPSKTNTVSVPDVFTAVLFKGNTWLNPVYYRYYCQTQTSGVFGGMIGSSNGKGRFMGGGEGRFNDRWTNFYDMLTQYRVLEKTYNKLDESEQSANKVYLMVSRSILESQLHEMLSLFGAVPFKGAGTLWENSDYTGAKQKAAYDDDADLYKMILQILKKPVIILQKVVLLQPYRTQWLPRIIPLQQEMQLAGRSTSTHFAFVSLSIFLQMVA